MTRGPLTGADIRRLLTSLAAELDGRGIQADLFLVGGAAMAVAGMIQMRGRSSTGRGSASMLPPRATCWP